MNTRKTIKCGMCGHSYVTDGIRSHIAHKHPREHRILEKLQRQVIEKGVHRLRVDRYGEVKLQ